MKSKAQPGFTLLELLIVMAIIGLLSAIILVGYQGQTDKARLAKTMQWAISLNHLLGVNTLGAWTFDRITGTTVYDDSSNKNDGTIYGGATVVDGVIGKALSFDGNDYVNVSNSSNLINYTGLTLEAWIKPSSDGVYGGIFNKYYYPGSCYLRQFLLRRESSNQICFWMGYNSGANAYVICTPTANPVLAKDGWIHIVATWSGQLNTMKIYLNSKVMVSYTGALDWTTNTACSLEIGRYTGSYYFNGLIDDVRIFSEALPQAQIEQFYADGLKTHHPLAQQ